MKIEKISISELKHPERNARRHPEKQIQELRRSLSMFGQTRPVVIDENNTIIVGNGMVMAMTAAGWKKAEVFRKKGLTEAQKKKLMLADNKIYSLGFDDPEAQFALIEQIIGTGTDLDFEIPGFDEHILQAFISSEDDVDEAIDNYGTEIEPPPAGQDSASFPIDQQADREDPAEAGIPESNPQRIQGEKMTQVRCPHCGEILWV